MYWSRKNPTRAICESPTNLLRKAPRFFLLLASDPRAARPEVHQVLLEGDKRCLRRSSEIAILLCDSQTLTESRDRAEHPPYIRERVSNPSSLSIIYETTKQLDTGIYTVGSNK